MSSSAQQSIFRAPIVIQQADACGQHLGAGQQCWIVEALAYELRLLNGSDASIRINKSEGPHQITESAHLSCFKTSLSRQGCCFLVRFGGVRNRAKCIMS